MSDADSEKTTEWIFCRDIKGKCSGISPNTKILEKIPKTIKIHGEEVPGWKVKIEQDKSEGHVNLNLSSFSDE